MSGKGGGGGGGGLGEPWPPTFGQQLFSWKFSYTNIRTDVEKENMSIHCSNEF